MISSSRQPSPIPSPSSGRGDSLVGRRVSRMNGAGNKILVLDLRGGATLPTPAEACAIHRAPGLDYDQLMILSDPRDRQTLAHVTIYNNDGFLAGACGNGTRCVADRLARQTGLDSIVVETAAGLIACERLGPWTYRVDMGRPRLAWNEIPLAHPVADTREVDVPLDGAGFGPASVVDIGNPHAVFFVRDVAAVDLERWGPRYETHPLFPEKANISFAEVKARDRIALRVWERGVGTTLACGSAACAALVSAVRRGLAERTASVAAPGGELVITWRQSDGRVLMTGPVEFEREVVLEAGIFSASPKDTAP
jgi:diaminopimelate epimerase